EVVASTALARKTPQILFIMSFKVSESAAPAAPAQSITARFTVLDSHNGRTSGLARSHTRVELTIQQIIASEACSLKSLYRRPSPIHLIHIDPLRNRSSVFAEILLINHTALRDDKRHHSAVAVFRRIRQQCKSARVLDQLVDVAVIR